MTATRSLLAAVLPALVTLCALVSLSHAVPAQNPRTGLLWSTYLGGTADDSAAFHGLGIAENGDALVWGWTGSDGAGAFPTQGAYQSTYGGPTPSGPSGLGDGFFARLAADGSALVWSSYLGGSGIDAVLDVETHPGGTITVCGVTGSPNFPTTPGAYQTAPSGGYDAFVARFAWDGQQLTLLWSTRFGGSLQDSATSVVVAPNGNIYVAGTTTSSNLPMAGSPYQQGLAGGSDVFLAVFDSTGSALLASTYLGGIADDAAVWSVVPNVAMAYPVSLALDAAGNPVVGGLVQSTDFPTTANALQQSYGGGLSDTVVAVLGPGLGRLLYSTYLGGTGPDWGWSVTMAPDGRFVVCGGTGSPDFRTTANCYDPTYNGGSICTTGNDAFVAIIDRHQPPASQLVWSTFFGSPGCEHALKARADAAGLVSIVGVVYGAGIPTTLGCFQPGLAGGGSEAFAALFDSEESGIKQLLYATHLGGSSEEVASSVVLDGLGNVVTVLRTQSSNLPTSASSFDPTYNGGRDAFVAKLNLLPQDVVRYGASTPACLHPIWQGVDSWPTPGNSAFTLMVQGAPPNQLGAIAFGRPMPGGVLLPIGLQALLSPVLTSALRVADARGFAEYTMSIPATMPPGPPYGLATQWFFLTTPQCPGIGPAGSSEGLRW